VTDDIAKGKQCTVVLDRYGADGVAVGPGPDGVEVHVAGALRGERAVVEIEHISQHRRQAWGRIISLAEASEHRTRDHDAPGHRCGGCSWAHLDEVAQREAKEARLQEVVDACGPPARGLTSPLVAPSPRMGGYRNRGKYVLARKHGQVVLGAYRPRSHEVGSTLGCPVIAPAVDETARALATLLVHRKWSIYDERQGRGLLRYAGIRVNHRREVLVTLVVSRLVDRPWKSLVKGLRRQVEGLVGLTLDVNPDPGNVLFSGEIEQIWGSAELVDRYGPAVVRLTGQGFGQVNRDVATVLYDHAATAALAPLPGRAESPALVWDLFSGAGALTQTLARRVVDFQGSTDILGVERDEAAVRLADGAARSAGLTNCHFQAGDANDLLSADHQGDLPEAVVLNPPRTGCRPALLAALVAQRIPRVVYVSCSVETLIRDLAILQKGGLRLQSLRGFDMLPMTHHLELVAVLER
jgi:23S rRNA (uracil1939-C5)-methyltransferase